MKRPAGKPAARKASASPSLTALGKAAVADLESVIARMQDDAADALIEAILKARRICTYGAGREGLALRLAYYEYIERGPRPSLAIIQDIDSAERGLGAFWGEVQSTVHQALDCAGVVTDGSIRDLDMWAKGFFALAGSVMPSHVHADLVDIDRPVTVAGMLVSPGDIVHADRHGAAVIPADAVADIPKICDLLARKEKVILDAARKPGFSTADIRAAFATMKDIH